MRLRGLVAALAGTILSITTLGVAPATAEPPAGTFTDLGPTVTSLTVMEGTYAKCPGGSDCVYAVVAGDNTKLNVIDVRTRELIKTIALAGASGGWGATTATDGSVYIGSYNNGRLYRYEPEADRLTDLGQPIPGEGLLYHLVPGPDGTVYGGTYPNAHLFAYSPTEGVTDFGRMDPQQNYVRSVAYDPDHGYLFAGIGARAGLVRIDLATGERTDVLPDSLAGYAFVYDLDYAGGRLLIKVHNGTDVKLAVLDPVTGDLVLIKDESTGQTLDRVPIASRGTAPLAPDGRSVYYTAAAGSVWVYDLETSTTRPVMIDGAPAAVDGAGIGFTWLPSSQDPTRQVLYGLAGNYGGRAFTLDPQARTLEKYTLPFQPVPVDLSQVHAGADGDGKVYTSAYINGDLGVYDPAAETLEQFPRLGQVEGWTWYDGKLYIGTYPTGSLREYDPALPWGNGNPRVLVNLAQDHLQNRPTAMAAADGRLYAGTTPDYGEHGGALTVVDLDSGDYTVRRHIVQNQTVSSIALLDDLYGGTSIAGGGGTAPIATEAKLFTADPVTGEKTGEFAPVPGAYSINALLVGPDGNLWGLADGTLFVLDPQTHKVLSTTEIFDGNAGETDGDLVIVGGEYVYGHSASRLFRIDPLSRKATIIRQGGTRRLTVDPRGDLYLLHAGSGTNINRLLRYRPPADACPGSDLRPAVFTRTVDSGVVNRYTDDGCTVNDLILDDRDWPTHGRFVAHVTSVAQKLTRAAVITDAEADALVAAAARS